MADRTENMYRKTNNMLVHTHTYKYKQTDIDTDIPGPTAKKVVPMLNARKKLVYFIVDFFCLSRGRYVMTVSLVSPRYKRQSVW